VPPHYVLQDVNLLEELKARWWHKGGPFFAMQEMLRRAANVDALHINNKRAFSISVTEEEILNGIFNNQHKEEQSLFIRREIIDTEQLPADRDAGNRHKKHFVDMLDDNVDEDAINHLNLLKERLTYMSSKEKMLHINVSSHEVLEAQDKKDVEYIHNLSNNVCSWLWDHTVSAYRARKAYPPLLTEVVQHLEFMKQKLSCYVNIPSVQEHVKQFLEDANSNLTFALHARSGGGKTSLVAWAADHASRVMGIRTVVRFLGTTPQSSDVVSLLKSVCSQLREFLIDVDGDLGDKYDEKCCAELMSSGTHMQLSELMTVTLAKLSEKGCHVCLFLDSLDQLSPQDHAYDLLWLPSQSFPGVKVIVSMLDPTPEQV
jgi:hypothetical protein